MCGAFYSIQPNLKATSSLARLIFSATIVEVPNEIRHVVVRLNQTVMRRYAPYGLFNQDV